MQDQINPPRYTAAVSQKQQFSEYVFFFDLAISQPDGMHFTPGQFVNVTVGENTRRQYSIASSPARRDRIQLLVDIGPGGTGSKYFEALAVNDTVELSAPMGRFSLVRDTGVIVFIAASTGIAPFKSMIDYLIEKQTAGSDSDARSIYLCQSFRYEKDIFWKDYFEEAALRNSNFHYSLTLSQPGEGWAGASGYVQSLLEQTLLKNPESHFYICGGNKMVQGVLEHLRAEQIPDDRIHFEPF